MHMKVMKEQFVLDGDKLTHMPTGATFWLGDKDVVACEQGRLELDTGDDYDLDELKEEPWHIMVQRKAGNGITDPIFNFNHQGRESSHGYRRGKSSMRHLGSYRFRELEA
jgi:hypothetical protein